MMKTCHNYLLLDLSVIKEPDDLVYFPSFHHKPTAVVQPTSAVVQRSTPSETIISSTAGVVNSEAVTDMANFQLSIDMSEDMFGEDFLDQVVVEPRYYSSGSSRT